MNAAEMRRSFADFSIDRYRQFIAAIWSKAIPKQRLVYWQQQLWREYPKSAAAALPFSFAEIQRVFQVCPRHLEPLEVPEQNRVRAIAALLGDVSQDDRAELFPFAVVTLTQRGVTESLSCPVCVCDLEASNAAARPSR